METTFRETLVRQLMALAASRELDQDTIHMGHIEAKQDVIGEFLDYYTDDLMRYGPFAAEFGSDELSHLRQFVLFLGSAAKEKTGWAETRFRASALSERLRVKSA
jgi:hypothetical protein